MSKRDHLITAVLAASDANHWDEAREEWTLKSIYKSETPEQCVCTHFPIIEICTIRNLRNGNLLDVGNCCVKNFMGLPSDTLFNNLRRIIADASRAAQGPLIELAYSNGWITEWERGFSLNTASKRNLSAKQFAARSRINVKIINGTRGVRLA